MEHRSIARVIAFIDAVIAVLNAIGVIIIIVAVVKDDGNTISGSAVWIVIGIAIVFVLLEVLGAFFLLRGTSELSDDQVKLRFTRYWRGITIFFAILQILGVAGMILGAPEVSVIVVGVILTLYRVIAIYLVQRYLNQLQAVLPMF